jgi:hypothetical protein
VRWRVFAVLCLPFIVVCACRVIISTSGRVCPLKYVRATNSKRAHSCPTIYMFAYIDSISARAGAECKRPSAAILIYRSHALDRHTVQFPFCKQFFVRRALHKWHYIEIEIAVTVFIQKLLFAFLANMRRFFIGEFSNKVFFLFKDTINQHFVFHVWKIFSIITKDKLHERIGLCF